MEYFGHQNTTKNIIVSFLDFFSGISVEKYGTVTVSGEDAFVSRKIIPVPIAFANREKWVEIIRSSSARRAMNPDIRDKNPVEMKMILPRMACSISGFAYDSNRKLIKTQQITQDYNSYSHSGGENPAVYTPAPYNINLELTVATRHLDDALQIMEQIVPYFAPSLSMDIQLFPDRKPESVPFVLESVTTDIPTDLAENDERLILFNYNFTVKTNYYFQKKIIPNALWATANLGVNTEFVKIDLAWIKQVQEIQQKFDNYISMSGVNDPMVAFNAIPIVTATPSGGTYD